MSDRPAVARLGKFVALVGRDEFYKKVLGGIKPSLGEFPHGFIADSILANPVRIR